MDQEEIRKLARDMYGLALTERLLAWLHVRKLALSCPLPLLPRVLGLVARQAGKLAHEDWQARLTELRLPIRRMR